MVADVKRLFSACEVFRWLNIGGYWRPKAGDSCNRANHGRESRSQSIWWAPCQVLSLGKLRRPTGELKRELNFPNGLYIEIGHELRKKECGAETTPEPALLTPDGMEPSMEPQFGVLSFPAVRQWSDADETATGSQISRSSNVSETPDQRETSCSLPFAWIRSGRISKPMERLCDFIGRI